MNKVQHGSPTVFTLCFVFALIAMTALVVMGPSYAHADGMESEPIASAEFDLSVDDSQQESVELADGTMVTLGLDKPGSLARALVGTRVIWGDNGLARMEYTVTTAASGGFTRITNAYGLAVTGRPTGISNERIVRVRNTETASLPAIVEGYAKFHYLGVVNASIWQQTGGVRASYKNDKVSVSLY